VDLYLNVFDQRNRALTNLAQDEFQVFEDGKLQSIARFTAARQPLSVALLLDASNSMGTGERIETARRAALDFIKGLASPDRATVFSFNDKVSELQPLTADHKKLEKAIDGIEPSGGTALYDALVQVAERMKSLEGRKAAILLSDGRDQAFRENAPGSLHLFDEALDAVVHSDLVVYAIGLGAHLNEETDLQQRRSLRDILDTLAEKTGGRFFNPERPGQLSGIYQQISEDLGRQYSLSYSPLNQARDGRWRSVKVLVDQPGARVITRPGYFAPAR
jgi:Ca-activated chloride channel family protein